MAWAWRLVGTTALVLGALVVGGGLALWQLRRAGTAALTCPVEGGPWRAVEGGWGEAPWCHSVTGASVLADRGPVDWFDPLGPALLTLLGLGALVVVAAWVLVRLWVRRPGARPGRAGFVAAAAWLGGAR